MNFISFEFLLFTAITWVLYILASRRVQNWILVAASLIFLASWGLATLIAFLLISSFSFALAATVARASSAVWRRSILLFGTGFILALLFLVRLRGVGAISLGDIAWIGLSFYALQALGYVFDVYRRQTEPAESPLAFLNFMAFFPLLTLGPIERFQNLSPQFRERRNWNSEFVHEGLYWIALGVFKKLVIADRIARLAPVFGSALGAVDIWLCLLLFLAQLYCDFSAYADLARGLARLFGIDIVPNFDQPYLARNIGEFWNRWNLSLVGWFRSYVYWPVLLWCRNVYVTTFIVFILIGCWHSLRWNFLTGWIYLASLYVLWLALKRKRWLRPLSQTLWGDIARRLFLLLCLSVTGIFFYARTLVDLHRLASGLIRFDQAPTFFTQQFKLQDWLTLALGIALVVGLEMSAPRFTGKRLALKTIFVSLVLLTILLGVAQSRYFLYMAY